VIKEKRAVSFDLISELAPEPYSLVCTCHKSVKGWDLGVLYTDLPCTYLYGLPEDGYK